MSPDGQRDRYLGWENSSTNTVLAAFRQWFVIFIPTSNVKRVKIKLKESSQMQIRFGGCSLPKNFFDDRNRFLSKTIFLFEKTFRFQKTQPWPTFTPHLGSNLVGAGFLETLDIFYRVSEIWRDSQLQSCWPMTIDSF